MSPRRGRSKKAAEAAASSTDNMFIATPGFNPTPIRQSAVCSSNKTMPVVPSSGSGKVDQSNKENLRPFLPTTADGIKQRSRTATRRLSSSSLSMGSQATTHPSRQVEPPKSKMSVDSVTGASMQQQSRAAMPPPQSSQAAKVPNFSSADDRRDGNIAALMHSELLRMNRPKQSHSSPKSTRVTPTKTRAMTMPRIAPAPKVGPSPRSVSISYDAASKVVSNGGVSNDLVSNACAEDSQRPGVKYPATYPPPHVQPREGSMMVTPYSGFPEVESVPSNQNLFGRQPLYPPADAQPSFNPISSTLSQPCPTRLISSPLCSPKMLPPSYLDQHEQLIHANEGSQVGSLVGRSPVTYQTLASKSRVPESVPTGEQAVIHSPNQAALSANGARVAPLVSFVDAPPSPASLHFRSRTLELEKREAQFIHYRLHSNMGNNQSSLSAAETHPETRSPPARSTKATAPPPAPFHPTSSIPEATQFLNLTRSDLSGPGTVERKRKQPSASTETIEDKIEARGDESPSSKRARTQPPEDASKITVDFASNFMEMTDDEFITKVKAHLNKQRKWKTQNFGRRQAMRIYQVLNVAQPPDDTEAQFASAELAANLLEPGSYYSGIIITKGQQPRPLQTTTEFLDEYYDDSAKVFVQDASVEATDKKSPFPREVTIAQLKERFFGTGKAKKSNLPWNCLELATHVEDGLRPAFLAGEDCRLLTKLKHPSSEDQVSRRGYDPGWKEVEKWALLAQAGSLTEPHQDSHGYNTYITVNQGLIGYMWLANPSAEERQGWRDHPQSFKGGKWRYVVLRPGDTVYFPSGTVHSVFRLNTLGDTLAFGGHVLRCSQIVRWIKTLLEEQDTPNVTNEDLTVSAPAYLERVEKFVQQAKKNGRVDIWGGEENIDEFLELKKEFMKNKDAALKKKK